MNRSLGGFFATNMIERYQICEIQSVVYSIFLLKVGGLLDYNLLIPERISSSAIWDPESSTLFQARHAMPASSAFLDGYVARHFLSLGRLDFRQGEDSRPRPPREPIQTRFQSKSGNPRPMKKGLRAAKRVANRVPRGISHEHKDVESKVRIDSDGPVSRRNENEPSIHPGNPVSVRLLAGLTALFSFIDQAEN